MLGRYRYRAQRSQFSDEKFIDENFDVYVAHGCIVLTNWADGHNHIYLYKYNEGKTDSTSATLEKQLTKGDFEVGEVLKVDPDRKQIYYASSESSPLDQQVWQVGFDSERKQLTTGSGNHTN